MLSAPLAAGERDRALAYLIGGLVQSMRASAVTIAQAEADIFRLGVYQAAKEAMVDPRLIDAIEWGMQLDDVLDLAPEAIGDSYDAIDRLCRDVLAAPRTAAA